MSSRGIGALLAFPRAVLVALAAALVLVAVAGAADGSAAPVLVLAISTVLIVLAAARVPGPSEARWLTSAVLVAFALRAIVAAVLVLRSLALGNGGFTTGDDIWYASAAGHLARYLQGDPEFPFVPPAWNGEYYLMTTYVYVASAIFWVFGQHVLNMILVNALLGALTVLLAADVAGRTFGRPAAVAATVVLAVFPSTVLWSAVNLRDTMTTFFIVATLWALVRYIARPSLAWIAVAFLAVWAEEGLRNYVEVVLLVVALLTVLVAYAAMGPARRIRWPLAASIFAAGVLIQSGLVSFVAQPLLTLGNIGEVRVSNQFGRTAFGTASPTPQAGASASGTPAPSAVEPSPTAPGVTVTTVPGTVSSATPPPPTSPPAATAPPTPSAGPATPAPTIAPTAAPTVPVTPLPRLLRPDVDTDTAVSRSLTHLPVGVVYTLFAPFPWSVRTPTELAATPDVLLWYLVLACAFTLLWTQRRRWSWFVPEVLFLGALLFLLALGEGNVGTLFRHRAMAIPAAVVLASPTLAALGRRALAADVSRRWARRARSRLAAVIAR